MSCHGMLPLAAGQGCLFMLLLQCSGAKAATCGPAGLLSCTLLRYLLVQPQFFLEQLQRRLSRQLHAAAVDDPLTHGARDLLHHPDVGEIQVHLVQRSHERYACCRLGLVLLLLVVGLLLLLLLPAARAAEVLSSF